MKYFGTDGIRGLAGATLTNSLLKKIAKAIVKFYNKHKLKHIILIGNDTRTSSYHISSTIESLLLEYGIEVHDVGQTTSPCLAFITKQLHYPLSMMISASHNSHEYNGIKFFNHQGEKLSTNDELELEKYMDMRLSLHKSYAIRKYQPELCAIYTNHLLSLKKSDHPAIFDCANGATSGVINLVFPAHKKINAKPNGNNINLNSGCTNIESLCIKCRKDKMVGFAFDGDGDRVIMVDESGNIINGDKLLYILSQFYLGSGDKLIGTIYSNEGLKKSLEQKNITLVRANVGDKNVYEKMCQLDSNLGGENSGHIIVKNYTNTGDGILNAILILNILKTTNTSIKNLLKNYQEYHQEYLNLRVENLPEFDYKKKLDNFTSIQSRIVVRPSGTEPLLRIMVEDKDESNAKKMLEKIKEKFLKTIKKS